MTIDHIKPATTAKSLDDQSVLDFLRKSPDFFLRHPSALSELTLPHESGKAVSLIERQVDILRDRNVTMRKRMNELLHAARANDEIFAKTRSLNLALLEVSSWPELNEVLATHVLVDFEADFVCAHLCGAGMALALDHIQHHNHEMPLQHLQSNTSAQCISLRKDELTQMFPLSDHDDSGSAAILDLTIRQGSGALCIGSRDPSRFSKGMDTLFVTYIADIVAKVMDRLAGS
ncbi:DUF484 family protein [Pseudomonadales bacterium]|jgi:uncharacterized protein YigA (DUF484 family)|nr:DUF484 family protein [Pseudomonadales bacterium]